MGTVEWGSEIAELYDIPTVVISNLRVVTSSGNGVDQVVVYQKPE